MSILQSPVKFYYKNSSYRVVSNLLWAKRCKALFGPQKHEGARLAGIRFEKRFFNQLRSSGYAAVHNPWIHFEDENGEGYACPDIVIPNRKIIIECKLSMTGEALGQIKDLYLPLCEEIWGAEGWRLIVAVKNWNGPPKRPILEISEAPIGAISFMLA